MTKMLMIYPDRCTGCQNCTLACSVFHDGEFRPHTSRIQVTTWEMEGFSMPTTCQQCEDAPCVAVCPTGAMAEKGWSVEEMTKHGEPVSRLAARRGAEL